MSKFWFLPISFILLTLGSYIINLGNILENKPIVANDYSFGFIIAVLAIAVVLEFAYLFVEKMVLE